MDAPLRNFQKSLFQSFSRETMNQCRILGYQNPRMIAKEIVKDSAGEGFQHDNYQIGRWPTSAILCFEEMVSFCRENFLYLSE